MSSDPRAPRRDIEDWDVQGINERITTCKQSHTCKPQDEQKLPSRVLDIGEPTSETIRLVVPSEGGGAVQTGHYAALSYSWGSCSNFTLTATTLDSRKRGFHASELPLTLRDAVQVTRQLGLCYLWIDALCILQDSEADWKRESARMGDIYGFAYITIFAFGAKDCQSGLFARSQYLLGSSFAPDLGDTPKSEQSSDFGESTDFGDRSDSEEILDFRQTPDLHTFKNEPLNSRGWALQEWHLSSRRLLFERRRVSFDCFQGPPRREHGHAA
ncbi:HET domain-containing protein [Seiridium cupressi]